MTYWNNKVVVITGSSSGVGKEIAKGFLSTGATVVISGRDEGRLDAAKEDLDSDSLFTVRCDVTDDASVEQLVRTVISEHGQINVWINNAGKSDRGTAKELTVEQCQDAIDMNFLSTVRCTNQAMPYLIESQGHLINMGSLAAKSAGPFIGAYAIGKHPLTAYTQQLRPELKTDGVHVMFVCPGPIARDDPSPRYQVNNDMPESAAKPGAGIRLNLIDPAKLTKKIIKGCETRKPEIIIPRKARLYFALFQLFPRFADWYIAKKMKSKSKTS